MNFDDIYAVKNGHIHIDGETTSEDFKAGELQAEVSTKEIVKKTEGVIVNKIVKIDEFTLSFVGRIAYETLRKVYGIDTEGLKPGVYSYGNKSKGKKAALTFDALDMFETDTLRMAFPNTIINSGLKISIANGEDEVAETELEFSILPDEYDNHYYEGFKSKLSEEINDMWHTKFDSALVQDLAGEVPNA
ncbi:hypothetical protein NSA24_10505 [Clostridioides mangenotii]|uniref:hypothetical protein n=1 Tax=Metaclostridioides mangenotii TaxID=1540 RepID=UPI00214A7249|nr:hypothetical protein [Clostridioides mangenotii]MCR1955223.1 hypothetical protein [Clostridioides mangenotii]